MTTKAWVKYDEISSNEGNFIIQPLDKGLGITLGNSLRRVLLSSLEGHGIQGVKIYSWICDVVSQRLPESQQSLWQSASHPVRLVSRDPDAKSKTNKNRIESL